MAGKRRREVASTEEGRKRKPKVERNETTRWLRERVARLALSLSYAQSQLAEITCFLAENERELTTIETGKGTKKEEEKEEEWVEAENGDDETEDETEEEEEEEEEMEENGTEVRKARVKQEEEEEKEEEEEEEEDGDKPSGFHSSKSSTCNGRNHEKWQRFKDIFSLYYAENGHLKIPISYQYQSIKIGIILSNIRHNGNFVRDYPPRRQWLLEKGVSFTYDTVKSRSEKKWQKYKEIFSHYYAENGHLKIPQWYQFQGVKIGRVLNGIRSQGCLVKDHPQRKQWLLEKGVSF